LKHPALRGGVFSFWANLSQRQFGVLKLYKRMDFLRRLIASTLVLSLLATSGAMAVARGSSDVGTLMVICTGQTYTVMEIGADGTPIERAHICPDCTLSLIVSVGAPAMLPKPQVLARILSATAPAQTDPRTPFLRTHARGPPTLV
jgi:hypothetical protein